MNILLLSFSPGGSLAGRGTGKDLKICCCSHSPSKTNAPLIISHSAALHGGLCDQRLWESAGIWQTTALVERRRRRRKKKKVSLLFLRFLHLLPALPTPSFHQPRSLCIGGQHLGSFIPTQAGWRTPVPSRVAGSERASVWVLVVVEERRSRLPTRLSGPSQSSHPPFPCLPRPLLPQAPPPAHPRCP